MLHQAVEYLYQAIAIAALVNISIWPPLIYFQGRQIQDKLERLGAVDISDDDPDDPEEESSPTEKSNVVAIGKRVA